MANSNAFKYFKLLKYNFRFIYVHFYEALKKTFILCLELYVYFIMHKQKSYWYFRKRLKYNVFLPSIKAFISSKLLMAVHKINVLDACFYKKS